MTECPYLQEYYQLYKDGEVYSTNVGGKSLSEILHDYCKLKIEARQGSTSQNQSLETSANISNVQTFKTPRETTTQPRESSTRYSDTVCCNSQVPNSSRGAQGRSSTESIHSAHNKSLPNFGSLSSPSTHKSCQSDPSRKLHFARTEADKAKQRHLFPHQSPATICSDDESVIILDSYLHGEQDMDNSSVCSASVTLVASDNFSHSDVNSPHSSVYETVEGHSEDYQASNVNRSVATSSVSLTPRRTLKPHSYHRSPATNSPRITLSYDRSQVSSLTTPLKQGYREDFISPRRKTGTPRRRRLNDSPLPKATIGLPLNVLHNDLESILEEIFSQQPLAQRIADNINKRNEDQNKIPESQSSGFVASQDNQASDGSTNRSLQGTEGAPALHSNTISMDSNRHRDDMNSTREPASYPNEISGHTKEPDTPIPESSLPMPEPAPATSSSEKEKTLSDPSPEGVARPEAGSENNAVLSEVQPAASEVSARGLEDTPMDVVDCDGRSASVLNSTQAPEELTEDKAEESGKASSQPGLSKSGIKEVSIGTPFNIETQMVVSPSVVTSTTVNPHPNKGSSTPSNTDPSLNSGVSVSSTPLNMEVSNTGVAADMLTLPNGNVSFIPTMQNSFYQTPTTFLQLPYPNLSTSYLLPSGSGPGGIQYTIVVPGPNCQEQPSSMVQTIQPALEGTSMLNQSPLKIPADYSPFKSLWAGSILQNNSNVGSFVTVSSDNKPTKKKKKINAFDVSDAPMSKNIVTTYPSIVAASESVQVKETSSSHNTQGKEQKPKKIAAGKKKCRLRRLFPSPPEKNIPNAKDSQNEGEDQFPVLSIPEPCPSQTESAPKKTMPNAKDSQNEVEDQFPVLSIPEPSPSQTESLTAYEILQGIAGFPRSDRKTDQSPILKTLISSAKQWAGDGGIISAPCVRTLDFDCPAKNTPESSPSLCKETVVSQESVKPGCRKSSRLLQKSCVKTPQKASKGAADKTSSKQRETTKSRSRSRSSNKSVQSVTNEDHQSDQGLPEIITTIEDVISYANENYTEAILQNETIPEKKSDTPSKKTKTQSPKKPNGESGKKNETQSPEKPNGEYGNKNKTQSPKKPIGDSGNKIKTQSPEKPNGESGNISRENNFTDSPDKEKTESPKNPVAESSFLSREKYFPSSDSDTSSENVPLSSILAAKKAANSNLNKNVSEPVQQGHLQSAEASKRNPSVEIPDFESTNDKPSEHDDDYIPSKMELQYVSGEAEARTTRSSNQSKKVSRTPKRTVIPKFPPKSEFRSSGKLQAMFRSMLHNSSREERVESDEDSSESEKDEPEVFEKSSSLEGREDAAVEPPSNLEKTVTDNPPSITVPTKHLSPVKSAKKTVKKSPVKNISNVNSTRSSAVLNIIKDSKKPQTSTMKQRIKPLKPEVCSASKNDVRTGDSPLNFVPSVNALRKSPKNPVPPLNLNTFANDEVMERLLKGSTNVSHGQQSSLEGSRKEIVSTPSSTNTDSAADQGLNRNKADSSISESSLPFQNEYNRKETTEKGKKTNVVATIGSESGQIEERMSNSQSLSQKPITSPHERQSSGSFVNPQTTSSNRVKVLPPPKKRIRPVPSTSQFSPFLTLASPEQITSLDLSSLSHSHTLPSASGESTLLGEPTPKKTTPLNLPKGKPRAMMEYCRQLSPETMSSSSCTLDTFIARCKAKAVEASENEPLNLVSPAKRMNSVNVGVKRKLSHAVFDESWEKDLVFSPDKIISKEPTNVDGTMSKEDLAGSPEKVEANESLSLFKSSSEEGVIESPEKRATRKSSQDSPVRKKMKHSEIEPAADLSKTDVKITDEDSYEEGMIIDSPCKETDQPSASVIKAGCHDQNTERSPNPVDFSQSHVENRSSPVRCTAFVEQAPHQVLRKKFELNPKFPAGVKFPRHWNNSKLSHYSQSIEKNAMSENDSLHSKGAKTRKQTSRYRLRTPKKRHSSDHKRYNSHSSHRSSESRFSGSGISSSRSRYDYRKSSYYRSPFKHRYNSDKSARTSNHLSRKNVHDRRSRSVSQRRPSPMTEKLPKRIGSDYDAEQHSFRSPKHFKNKSRRDLDKRRLNTYTPPTNEKQMKDSTESPSNIRDSVLKHTKPDSYIDTEVNVHSEIGTATKVIEKQKSEEKCSSDRLHSKKSSDRKATFCAGDKDLPNNRLNDSGKRSKSPDSGKLALSSVDKKSGEVCKNNSKLAPSQNSSSELEKRALVTKIMKQLEEMKKTGNVDKGCKVNLPNDCGKTPMEPDVAMPVGENKSLPNDTVNSKGCMSSNLEHKKDETSKTPKQRNKRKKSLPTKRSLNVSNQQISPLTTPSILEEKAVSPGNSSENLGRNINSDKSCLKNPLPSSIKNKNTSSCVLSKLNTSELKKTKEQLSKKENIKASAVVLEQLENKCTSTESNNEKNATELKKVAPSSSEAKESESTVQVSSVLEKSSKKLKAREHKKTKEQICNVNAEASLLLETSVNQTTNNVTETSSIPPPDTSHQKKQSRKVKSDIADIKAGSELIKTKPKRKVKKKPVIDAVKEQPETEQTSSTPEANLNMSKSSEKSTTQSKLDISEADLDLNTSRTSTDQHELEEAVASICGKFGSQDFTPRKNPDGSNWSEASASNALSEQGPSNPEQESCHSRPSDLACSESKSEKGEKGKAGDANMAAIFSQIKKFGVDSILDLIRRKAEGKE